MVLCVDSQVREMDISYLTAIRNWLRQMKHTRSYEAEEREMTKSIIGTISAVDTPLTPKTKGSRSMGAYFSEMKVEDVQKERDEILSTSVEDIRRAADMVDAILADGRICVLGNEEKVKENAELFGCIDTL